MKTILVTGGGGFIGSNLVAGLLARGTHNVVVCDTFGHDDKWRNLARHAVFDIITPDRKFAWLDANKQNLECIYHLAAISSTVEKNVDLLLEHNFSLSVKLWQWCDANVVRLIYTSSSPTYGNGSNGFDDSIDPKYLQSLRPMSGYGWCKHLFDMHVANLHARNKCTLPQWVGLKLFNVYGPNEYHKGEQQSVISKIAPHATQGAAVRLFKSYNPQYADGAQKRDVIYVKDVVKVMLWLFDHPKVSGLFNLGTGKASTFNEMAYAIFAALGKKPNIHYIYMPEALVPHYQYFTEAKMDRLRKAGYTEAFTPVADGIKDYVQNYLTREDPYL